MKDRPRALAVLVAIFLIGIIVGTAGSYFWFKPSVEVDRPVDNRRPPSPKIQALPRFPNLDLTSEQKEQFGEIAKETREEIKALEKEQRKNEADLFAKRNSILEEHNSKIRSILNEEQIVKFDDFLEKSRDWWQRTPRRMGPEQPKEKRRKSDRL